MFSRVLVRALSALMLSLIVMGMIACGSGGNSNSNAGSNNGGGNQPVPAVNH